MNVPQGEPWTPSHELLAAFADGELDFEALSTGGRRN